VRLSPLLSRLLGRRRSVQGPGESLDVAAAAATPAPSSPPAKPRKRMSGGARLRRWLNPALRGSLTPACLLARLENGAEVIYALEADGQAHRVPEVPDGCPLVLSATPDDHRLGLDSPLAHQVAKSRLIRESGVFEPMAVVTARDAVYGTPVTRVTEWTARGIRLAPLAALADRLSAQHGANDTNAPSVTGFVFGNDTGSGSIAVFFARLPDGKSASYVSINPDDLSAVLEAFYTETGLPEDSEPLGFEQAEALAALTGFYGTYPTASDLLGIPTRLAWRGALVLSALACAGSGIWWMSINQDIESARLGADAAKSRASQHIADICRLVAADTGGFARLMGVDPTPALREAEALYLAGARVESTMTPQSHQHDVFVPLRGRDVTTGGMTTSTLESAMRLSRPGCMRTAIEYSGGLDEIRLRFRCPGNDAAAGAFRR